MRQEWFGAMTHLNDDGFTESAVQSDGRAVAIATARWPYVPALVRQQPRARHDESEWG